MSKSVCRHKSRNFCKYLQSLQLEKTSWDFVNIQVRDTQFTINFLKDYNPSFASTGNEEIEVRLALSSDALKMYGDMKILAISAIANSGLNNHQLSITQGPAIKNAGNSRQRRTGQYRLEWIEPCYI